MKEQKYKPIHETDNKTVPQPRYTAKESQYRDVLLQRMESAKAQRDQPWSELNDLDYVTHYDTNAKIANAYLRPKKNEQDVRIVSGIVKEKVLTQVSSLLNYDFGPNITAFDDNNDVLNGVGEMLEDFVEKSREIEDWDAKKRLIYKELADQGTCYVEETWVEPVKINKILKDIDWSEGVVIDKIKWEEVQEVELGHAEANLISGKNVYLGNFREIRIDRQPFVVVRSKPVPYFDAQLTYGNWERWKYVPRRVIKVGSLSDDGTSTSYGSDSWSLEELEQDMVEIVKYYDPCANEFQIFLNGVMMLPVGFPLSAVSPSGKIPIAKGDGDPISAHFAISTSVPMKAKVKEAVYDEFLRLGILKTQQSFDPPRANNTGRLLSKQLFYPSKITADIDPSEVPPLLTPTGVTPSEVSVIQMLRNSIDDVSISPLLQGQSPSGQQTKAEIETLKQEGSKKQGNFLAGVVDLEEQLIWLRIYNLIEHWTKPIDQRVDKVKKKLVDVYQTVVLDTDLNSGEKGKRVYEFTTDMDKLNRSQDQLDAEGDMLSEKYDVPVEKRYVNAEMLRTLKMFFKVDVQPTEKSTDQLDRVLFREDVMIGMRMFGPQAFNMEYLKQQFARTSKRDYEKMFVQSEQQQGMASQIGSPQRPGTQMSAQMKAPMQVQKPSINTVAA